MTLDHVMHRINEEADIGQLYEVPVFECRVALLSRKRSGLK